MTHGTQADLNYVRRTNERPFIDVNDFSRNRLPTETRTVPVNDARGVASSLEQEGFILLRQKMPVIDYNDADALITRYLPAVEELVQHFTGADKIIGTDVPIIRRSPRNAAESVRPAPFVHTDFTPEGARDLLERSWDRRLPMADGLAETRALAANLLDGDPADRRYKRALIIQTWRVLTPPPHDVPFAVCAANSVSDDDIVEGDYVIRFADGSEAGSVTSFYAHNPNHRWFSVSDIEPDEMLLFMGYDFDIPGRCHVPHSGYIDKHCPPDVVGRASVEARVFAFFDT